MSAEIILAVDQGTTNTKVLAVDSGGSIIAQASVPTDLRFPRPGWAESDAVSLVRSAAAAMERCIAQLNAPRVAGIGISNQRETAIVWERATLVPVGPAVSWQCLRSAELCDRLRADGAAERVRELSGLDLSPMFAAGKYAWLLGQVRHGRERAAAGELCVGTVDSWLAANLTGGAAHVTDLTNASRTQLLDLARLDWSDELLDLFSIPRAAMPAIVASAGTVGECRSVPALAGAPIRALIGDSHAAAVGHGVLAPGSVKATFGTGTSVLAPVSRPTSVVGLSSTVAWSRRTSAGREAVHAVEGNIYATGAALDLAAELVGLGRDVAELETIADADHGAANGVYFVPALSGLGAPHWDPTATGTIVGLTRGTGRNDLARAAFESIGFQVRDVLAAMPAETAGRELHVDGGAMRSDRLASLVAGITGRVVVRAAVADVSALGAAHLAGHIAGWWPDLADIDAVRFPTSTFEPTATAVWDERHARWGDAVARSRRWSVPSEHITSRSRS